MVYYVRMKKILIPLILGILILPQALHAAWWNPFTWKKSQNEKEMSTTTESVAVSENTSEFVAPSVEELLKRIAELEDKLEKALSKQREVAPAPVATSVSKTDSAVGLSQSQLIAKVTPAMVFVETATSSGSGIVIDPRGRILVPARAVWSRDAEGDVVGVADKVSVTFSGGTKKTARVVGIDEARDVAVLEILERGTYSFAPTRLDASVRSGDSVAIVSLPTRDGSGAISFTAGSVSQKTGTMTEFIVSTKPLDNGGAVINSLGEVIGLPNASACRVLEEMKTCLSYKVTVTSIGAVFQKLSLGMKLYRDKKHSTREEGLFRSKFEGIYTTTKEGVLIGSAVDTVSGANSFDSFNNKLVDDEDGKITKVYLNKLKISADRVYKVMDFLKSQSYELSVFLINESSAVESFDVYQKSIVKKIEIYNTAKLKEYQVKVKEWSSKKNEYDGYLTKINEVSHTYLMEEAIFIEKALEYIKAEQKGIIEMFSGETLEIF